MEISVFAKKRTTKEGKTFYSYLSRLTKKDGEELPVTVKFREETCKAVPATDCPCNIVVDKAASSLSKSKYETEDGATAFSYTLWVGAWEYGGEYVDHSLDDFE